MSDKVQIFERFGDLDQKTIELLLLFKVIKMEIEKKYNDKDTNEQEVNEISLKIAKKLTERNLNDSSLEEIRQELDQIEL